MGITKPQSIEERFRSLGLWQHRVKHRFNLREFARAGFFFEDSFDINDDPGRLRCAFCPAVIGNWQPEDDPWTEHALSVDYCPYVTRHKGEEFIERVKKEEEELAEFTDHLDDLMNPDETNCGLHSEQTSMGLFGIPTTAMRREQKVSSSINSGQRLGGATGNNSFHQHGYDGARRQKGGSDRKMDCKEARLASFDRVSQLIENDTLLNQIAESGFYFEGVDPHGIKVRCFRCSLALYDICENDDLWRMHAKMSNCAHVVNRKGQDFIQKVQAEDAGDNQENAPSSVCQTRKRKQHQHQESILETECRAKKRKQCEFTGDNFEIGMSKKPFAQQPMSCQEQHPEKSCTQQPVPGKEPDTKKLRFHQSVQNEEHDIENQFTWQSVLSKEQDAKKMRTHQSVQNEEHGIENQFTWQSVLSKEHNAKKMCTHKSVQKNKQHDIEKICTQRSLQRRKHDTYITASGCKRRPRYYRYNGRWCLIKWRSFVASRPFWGQQDNDRGSVHTGGDKYRGTNADEIVFLCCDLKFFGRNDGQGPCPNCLQDMHV